LKWFEKIWAMGERLRFKIKIKNSNFIKIVTKISSKNTLTSPQYFITQQQTSDDFRGCENAHRGKRREIDDKKDNFHLLLLLPWHCYPLPSPLPRSDSISMSSEKEKQSINIIDKYLISPRAIIIILIFDKEGERLSERIIALWMTMMSACWFFVSWRSSMWKLDCGLRMANKRR
jgi:hypothetical protein